jgi:hypothetical protein
VTTLAEYLDRTAALDLDIGTTPMPGIRPYLGTAAADDAITRAWYATAIDWCNAKLSERDFVVADGFANDAPPDACVLGVYEFVRVLRDYAARDNVIARKVKTGAREEEYPEIGTAGRVTAAGIAAWPYLEPYCEDPTMFASGGA